MTVRSALRLAAALTTVALAASVNTARVEAQGSALTRPASPFSAGSVAPSPEAVPRSTSPITTSTSVELLGPRRASSVAGVHVELTSDVPLLPVAAPPRAGRGEALAIVGGAAFVGGLLIGGDAGTLISIGGLAVGVYGLW
ncbi:MAG: hypothetical protein ABI910_13695, partial [Gemmatimonadota bacterium]